MPSGLLNTGTSVLGKEQSEVLREESHVHLLRRRSILRQAQKRLGQVLMCRRAGAGTEVPEHQGNGHRNDTEVDWSAQGKDLIS